MKGERLFVERQTELLEHLADEKDMAINDPAASCGVFGGIRTGSGHYHRHS